MEAAEGDDCETSYYFICSLNQNETCFTITYDDGTQVAETVGLDEGIQTKDIHIEISAPDGREVDHGRLKSFHEHVVIDQGEWQTGYHFTIKPESNEWKNEGRIKMSVYGPDHIWGRDSLQSGSG